MTPEVRIASEQEGHLAHRLWPPAIHERLRSGLEHSSPDGGGWRKGGGELRMPSFAFLALTPPSPPFLPVVLLILLPCMR